MRGISSRRTVIVVRVIVKTNDSDVRFGSQIASFVVRCCPPRLDSLNFRLTCISERISMSCSIGSTMTIVTAITVATFVP